MLILNVNGVLNVKNRSSLVHTVEAERAAIMGKIAALVKNHILEEKAKNLNR